MVVKPATFKDGGPTPVLLNRNLPFPLSADGREVPAAQVRTTSLSALWGGYLALSWRRVSVRLSQ